jgi:hypothetical protein
MKLSTRKHLKLAAYWAAFFVLAVALVVAASLIGAELAGASSQAGWALAKVASLVATCLCLLGYVVQQIEG